MRKEEGVITTRVNAGTITASPKVAAPTVAAPKVEAAPAAPAARSEAALRAESAAAVRARLAATPGVARIPKDRLEAYVVPHFLSEEECEGLMRLIDAGKVPSGLLAPTADPEFRTSESCNLSPADPLVGGLEARLNKLMGIEPQFGETVQGQRYAVGQQFKPHHDFFHTTEAYWKEQQTRGGQRTWTVMAFLNKPDAGGQTAFPKAGLKITPAPAHLLIWNNLDVNGELNDFSLHQGMPVEAGVKYVLTKWYRERPWNGFTGAGLAYY
ncbi:2OG-Fe(II) oxygenase [Sphingomonas parva]|uniref:2OG-Fe(II) oxygenase n=2 Tax=Sphingomonas parva TaxID=2555898 RepID=A0A4Y8ZRH8_9SPHN|nr:2OG-Fe(II) oxygenase [Sphingomonas parva]